MDALRPAGTGTMKEAVSGLPQAEGQPVGTHPDATTRPEIAAGGRAAGDAGEERGW
jgi:hypothetical protein